MTHILFNNYQHKLLTLKLKNMIEIIAGTPQPYDCPKCKVKHGYKITERIQKYIDLIYDEFGNNNGTVYSESGKMMCRMKKISCVNCNTTLPFKVVEGTS